MSVGGKWVEDVLQPAEVGVALGRDAGDPARVVGDLVAAPVGDVERRVGQDVVGAQGLVLVVGEAGAVALADVAVQPVHGQVHQAQAAGRSEERREGKECVSTCRYRGSPYN